MSDRAAAAEARRLKILARGKDRLSSITIGSAAEASTAKQPPENPTNVNPLGLDGPSPDNTQSERRNPNAETTAHAAAIATTTAAASSSMTAALPAASALNSGSGSFVDRSLLETFTVASATAPISGSSNAVRGTIPRAPMVDLDPDDLMLADPKLHSRGPSSSSTMLSGGTAGVAPGSSQGWGSRLQLAVRNTIPVRALLAVVAAALIFTGNLRAEMFLGLSPVLMLSVAQVAMILAMYSALGVHWIRIRVERSDAAFTPSGGPRLPSHLRGVDLMQLIPGLDKIVQGASGVWSATRSVGDAAAVLIVSLVVIRAVERLLLLQQ